MLQCPACLPWLQPSCFPYGTRGPWTTSDSNFDASETADNRCKAAHAGQLKGSCSHELYRGSAQTWIITILPLACRGEHTDLWRFTTCSSAFCQAWMQTNTSQSTAKSHKVLITHSKNVAKKDRDIEETSQSVLAHARVLLLVYCKHNVIQTDETQRNWRGNLSSSRSMLCLVNLPRCYCCAFWHYVIVQKQIKTPHSITPAIHQQLSPLHRCSSFLPIPLQEYLQDGGGWCSLISVELPTGIEKSQSTGKPLERNWNKNPWFTPLLDSLLPGSHLNIEAQRLVLIA